MSLEEQEKLVEKKINEIAKKFDSKINALVREFAVGSGLEVNKDMAVLNKEVLKELKDSGLIELYEFMLKIIEQITVKNISYYANISSIENDIRKSQSVKFVTDTLAKNLTGGTLQSVLAERITNLIKPYILSGGDYKTTVDVLRNILPKELQRYTYQITKGVFSVYDGAIQNTLKQKYNPKSGKYIGGLIDSSRPFCIHMKEKYGSRPITEDELKNTVLPAFLKADPKKYNDILLHSNGNNEVYTAAALWAGYSTISAKYYNDEPILIILDPSRIRLKGVVGSRSGGYKGKSITTPTGTVKFAGLSADEKKTPKGHPDHMSTKNKVPQGWSGTPRTT